MDADQIKDALRDVINHVIKDDQDEATKQLHDVLAAKMRARISPESVENSTETDDEVELTNQD